MRQMRPGEMRQGTADSAADSSPTVGATRSGRQAGRQQGGQAGPGQAGAGGSPRARSPHDAANAGAHFGRVGNSAGQTAVKFAHMSQSMSEAPLA